MAYDRASCVDSVLDSYVDMYGSEEEEDPDWEEGGADGYGAALASEAEEEQREPWDQRGKTGLYGGGGRGAENAETGWTRDSAEHRASVDSSAGQPHGYEAHQIGVGYSQGESPKLGNHYQSDRRDSSSASSSYGPPTPVNAAFPQSVTGYASVPIPSLPIRSTQAPVDHRRESDRGMSNSASRARVVHSVPAPARRAFEPVDDEPTLQITDSSPAAQSTPAASPSRSGTSTPQEHRVRKSISSTFRWSSRSKKTPTISNPILPDGFVESLGMSTFELSPSTVAAVTASTRRTAPAPLVLSNAQSQARHPQPSLERSTAGKSTISAIPLDFRSEVWSESEKRHSNDSDGSHYAASSLASMDPVSTDTRQLYFDGLREERSKIPLAPSTNTAPIASQLRRPSPPVLESLAIQSAVATGQLTPSSSFRDPLGQKSRLAAASTELLASNRRASGGRQSGTPAPRPLHAPPASFVKLGSRAIEQRRGLVTSPAPTNLHRRPSHDYSKSSAGGVAWREAVPEIPSHHLTTTAPTEKVPAVHAGWQPGW